jgi:hypothetical protein
MPGIGTVVTTILEGITSSSLTEQGKQAMQRVATGETPFPRADGDLISNDEVRVQFSMTRSHRSMPDHSWEVRLVVFVRELTDKTTYDTFRALLEQRISVRDHLSDLSFENENPVLNRVTVTMIADLGTVEA